MNSVVLYDLLKKFGINLDRESITEKVRAAKSKYPDYDTEELARKLSKRAARKCAAHGAAWGTLGGTLPFLGINPGFRIVATKQAALVLAIAHLYGKDIDAAERILEILECAGNNDAGEKPAPAGIKRVVQEEALKKAFMSLKVGHINHMAARVVPFAGAAYWSAANYKVTKEIGRKAVELYSKMEIDEADSSSLNSSKKKGCEQ